MPPQTEVIPLVDFSTWNSTTSVGEKQEIASQLTKACQTVGFVQIINHSISHEEIAEAFEWSKKLFDLEQGQKMLAPHPPGHRVHRGYSWPGLEKVSNSRGDESDEELVSKLRAVEDVKVCSSAPLDHGKPNTQKESYEIGSDDFAEQPNVWLPEGALPGFRDFATRFYWHSWENAKMILQALAIGLRLEDENFFLLYHSGHENQLRLLHYPPILAEALESGSKTRMDAHSDWGTRTMLLQDDCGGLEVRRDLC